MKTRVQPQRKTPTVDLGIAGLRVPVHSHLAYLWESEQDFSEAVGFVEAGLQESEYCVVSGDERDNERIRRTLEERGIDVEGFKIGKRLSFIDRSPWARVMLKRISATFEAALAAGSPVVRLVGNVAWGGESVASDAELFAYEARLTEIADRFPCVILCLHEVRSLTGLIMRHGVLATHPQMLEEGEVLGNPYFIRLDRFLERVGTITADFEARQREQEARQRQSEMLQTLFDNMPVMISVVDTSGRMLLVNREWERVLGWTLEEARRVDIVAELYPEPERQREVRGLLSKAEGRCADFRTRVRNGSVIDTSWVHIALSDGTRIGFGLDISQRKRAEEELQRSYEELRALSARLRDVREEESTRIAREVHDEVGQMLTALAMDVARLENKLETYPAAVRADLFAKLRSMSRLLDTTVSAVQRIVTELRPVLLDELGLEAAVEWYVAEFEKRTGIPCRFQSSLDGTMLDSDRATALFRILQEALTNVARHAGATAVEIRLTAEPGRVLLAVTDNGVGIPADKLGDSRSLGLLGMRERARALGGDVVIRRTPVRGTTVEAMLPL